MILSYAIPIRVVSLSCDSDRRREIRALAAKMLTAEKTDESELRGARAHPPVCASDRARRAGKAVRSPRPSVRPSVRPSAGRGVANFQCCCARAGRAFRRGGRPRARLLVNGTGKPSSDESK